VVLDETSFAEACLTGEKNVTAMCAGSARRVLRGRVHRIDGVGQDS